MSSSEKIFFVCVVLIVLDFLNFESYLSYAPGINVSLMPLDTSTVETTLRDRLWMYAYWRGLQIGVGSEVASAALKSKHGDIWTQDLAETMWLKDIAKTPFPSPFLHKLKLNENREFPITHLGTWRGLL